MRRPNHASRFEGIAKTNLQASRASGTEALQSRVNKAAKKRLSHSGLEILHGRRDRVVYLGDDADHPSVVISASRPKLIMFQASRHFPLYSMPWNEGEVRAAIG